MDTTKTATHVSLCAGYGGIDLGLKRAIPSLRTIAFSEIEAFACANLVAKMEAGNLDPAPIWTDVKTFPYASFHGKVDILSGGYPCQPFSAAGKRLGADDPRHLWPFIADGVAAMRPEWCFFENVEGHISLGLPNVIEDLAGMGYRTAWGIFSASEVGACHERRRVFILAHAVRERGLVPPEWFKPAEQDAGSEGSAWRTEDDWVCNSCGEGVFTGCECDHSESQCPSCGEWTYPFVYEPYSDGCSQCGELFPSWANHTTWPVSPVVCGGNDGTAGRLDRLRLLGNGVVPATAERAFKTLLQRLLTYA